MKSCSGLAASALDLFNVQNIELYNTLFTDCSRSSPGIQYRAHAGAVSIAYFKEEGPKTYPTITVVNCTFFNNRATLYQRFGSDQINLALNTNVFEACGGGLGLGIQDSYNNVQCHILNSTFQQNFAELFGGGMYVLISGNETAHTLMFENCLFLQNMVVADFGGGLNIGLLHKNLRSPPTNITVIGSRFEENSAAFGGGLSLLQARTKLYIILL